MVKVAPCFGVVYELLKPEEVVHYKAKFSALYDKGIESLCF